MARARQSAALGAILRKRRLERGLTQAQVADKVGCRANYVGYLESNARRPSPSVAIKLAKALDLDASEILLLANPLLRGAVAPQAGAVDTRSTWERFAANKRLQTRNGVTRAELAALEKVATLGPVRSQRDFLFILQTIRQALSDE